MSARAVLLVCGLWLAASAAEATVRAWVDHTEVASGDTVELTLEHDGQTDELPDLAALRQDFDIVSSARSSNVQIINGAVSAGTELQLALVPKRSGVLTVPAITWGAEHSLALKVTVSAAGGASGAGGAQAARDVFLETSFEPAQPYVQAAVNVTVRLFAAVPLHRASLDLPGSADVLVQQVGADSHTTAERNGRHYQVIERHYVLFPQHSGTLEVPGADLEAQVAIGASDTPPDNQVFADIWSRFPFGGLWGRLRSLHLHGEPIKLAVQPRPAAAFAQYWLPARDVTLAADWHPDRHDTHVGDPLTLTLHLEALGLTAAQLPDLSALLELPPGLKAYPDQARLTNGSRADTVLGQREQSVALIADQAGHFTIPALHLHWWDTASNAARETVLPEEVLDVLPAPGARVAAAPSKPPVNAGAAVPARRAAADISAGGLSSLPWVAVALGFALLWVLTLLAWWVASRRRVAAAQRAGASGESQGPSARARPTARDTWRAFREGCERNDPLAARRALLDWAAARWPEAKGLGLRAVAERLEAGKLAADELLGLLLDLERACYAGGEWRGAALLEALGKAAPSAAAPTSRKPVILGPLYGD